MFSAASPAASGDVSAAIDLQEFDQGPAVYDECRRDAGIVFGERGL